MAESTGTSSFYFGTELLESADSFGQAHALASAIGNPRAAAAIHYAIACLMPERGFAAKLYPCTYSQHYSGRHRKRAWGADRLIDVPEPPLDLARWAADHQSEIEALHARHITQPYAALSAEARLSAISRFRTAVAKLHLESGAAYRTALKSTPSRPVDPAAVPARSPDPDAFDASNEQDARDQVMRSVRDRRGQPEFRKGLLRAYDARCAITGCGIVELLEAAHICPYRGAHTNHVQNGLLLRADIHTLFDLELLWIDPDSYTVQLATELRDSEYSALHGAPLRVPEAERCRPSRSALRQRSKPHRI